MAHICRCPLPPGHPGAFAGAIGHGGRKLQGRIWLRSLPPPRLLKLQAWPEAKRRRDWRGRISRRPHGGHELRSRSSKPDAKCTPPPFAEELGWSRGFVLKRGGATAPPFAGEGCEPSLRFLSLSRK
ncbi:hypothetical protein NL676_031643 [Syzygium grande]|nr:hypothetical protein NL676_031643 [Syzygium grande]